MVGGTIVQITGLAVEVLDEQTLDRCWRVLKSAKDVRVGDCIWWMSHTGYLTRRTIPGFTDKNVGRCVACNPHGRGLSRALPESLVVTT